MSYPVSPAAERELEGTPELDQLRAAYRRRMEEKYPQPELNEIESLYLDLKAAHQPHQDAIREERKRRYQQDKLPAKWQLDLEDGRRFFSNLTANEIYRVVAGQCRNEPQFKILPAGRTEKARERAAKETRWALNCWQALERAAAPHGGLRWRWVDAQNESGIAAYEVYLTGAYDGVDTEQKEEEQDQAYVDRTDGQLIAAGLPFGVRMVDPLSLFFDRDESGLSAVIIAEYKPYKPLYRRMRERHGADYLSGKGYYPDRGDPGHPQFQHEGAQSGRRQECLTLRYYDAYWSAYVVDGRFMEEPEPHGLPGLPVFVGYGMTTSSPNLNEMARGICMGLGGMEMFVNDQMTLAADNAYTYSKQRWGIETPEAGSLLGPPGGAIELKPGMAVEFAPGQRLVNPMAGVRPQDQTALIPQALQFWQRSGQNPIAQGESPGSDPAGYTVNALTQSAQSNYERNLDNERVLLGNLMDFVRRIVRDTIKDRVPVSGPMEDAEAGGVEWLWISPEDISETPCLVTIDPLSDANRVAMAQHWRQGNKEGYVPREEVQKRGYGADDAAAWDRQIVMDTAKQALMPWLVEQARARVVQATTPPQAALPAQAGLANEPAVPGAIPAPVQPPTVGPAQAGASQFSKPGPAALPGATASAGQGGGPTGMQP